jgi:hypothetical protein
MTPGFIIDMFKIRSRYDGSLAGARMNRKLFGG